MGRRLGPVSRRNLVKRLRSFGWEGPRSRAGHSYMSKNGRKLTIPNDHGTDIRPALVAEILRQAGIARSDWLSRR
ncbi:MAG: type II toxin-antitoxin system HicA family toxin [bacterium]|nr:type II toxin-antitoxin system HicA family toxin [bacterium]MDE0353225.1 type II toxin-antitoxin system HicA family toxin [bacterium]